MNRRDFIAASGMAAAAPLTSLAAGAASPQTEYYELRQYHVLYADRQRALHQFLENAAVPAYNRIGINPVGVFTVMYGSNAPTVYMLVPHPNLESIETATQRLLDDPGYRDAEVTNTPISDPAYVRYESTIMRAFDEMPRLEIPAGAAEKRSRVFELRVYESHSEKALKKKLEMFNAGGEIPIFRNTGLTPVFFGETIAGPKMPNLTYMLVFDDLAQRDQAWDAFRVHPDWVKLAADTQYAGTVSAISDIILRPTAYSQI